MAWYDPNFAYKKAIVIPHGQVSGGSDLLDFPVLISFTDATFKSMANGGLVASSSGYDLLFTDGTETRELAYEVESYTASSGALVCWVRIPRLLVSQDTVIYLYFGNSTVTGYQATASNVWDSSYKGVWHLKEDPSGSAPQIKDSTTNANHLTSNGGMTTAQQVAGQIGGALQFVGANSQYLSHADTASLDFGTGDFTLEAWVYLPTLPSAYTVILNKGAYGVAGYGISVSNVNQPTGDIEGTTGGTNQHAASTTTLVAASWYHVVATFPRNDQIYMYVNGVLAGTSAYSTGNTTSVTSSYPFQLGAVYGVGDCLTGTLDEVRISAMARSASWIATEYANQSAPSSFILVGATIPSTGTLDLPLLEVSSVSTTQTSSDQLNPSAKGAKVIINVTSLTGGGTLTLTVQGKDITSGQYYTLASFAGIGLNTTMLTLYPGIASSSTSLSGILPRTWNIQVQFAGGSSPTASYTVGASLLV